MSQNGRRRATLALAALAATGMTAVAAAPGVSAAHPIGHLSEADALWMPHPTTVRALAVAPDPATAAPLPALTSAEYRYSSILDGRPVRWNPCQAIHWRAAVARGPVGGLEVLKAAVLHVASVTGTTWVFDGTTSTVPSTSYLPKTPTLTNKPVVIGWTDGHSSDLLAGRPPQVLGMTRTVWFGVDDGRGHRAAATRGAVVALNRVDNLPLRGIDSWTATALHELGHVMGLDHAADTSQLMAPVLPPASSYRAGDLMGLSRLGRAAGCVVIPGT